MGGRGGTMSPARKGRGFHGRLGIPPDSLGQRALLLRWGRCRQTMLPEEKWERKRGNKEKASRMVGKGQEGLETDCHWLQKKLFSLSILFWHTCGDQDFKRTLFTSIFSCHACGIKSGYRGSQLCPGPIGFTVMTHYSDSIRSSKPCHYAANLRQKSSVF